MNKIKPLCVVLFLGLLNMLLSKDSSFYLSNLSATKDSPLFATYAAAMERSEFTLDEGYHFLFYDSSRGIDFTTDTGGDLCLAFKKGVDYVYKSKDFYHQPVITASYPDMVKYYYAPYDNLQVDATFLVYSSHVAVHDVVLRNTGKVKLDFQVIPFIQNSYSTFNNVQFHAKDHAITFNHEELPDSWILEHEIPFVTPVQDVLLLSREPESMNSYSSYSDFLSDVYPPGQSKNDVKELARVIAMPIKIKLGPGTSEHFRIVRAVARPNVSQQELISRARDALDIDLNKCLRANEKLFEDIPKLSFNDPDKEMLYWSAFSLIRQVMLPPEEECSYNYYVFSREPQWGWGHGGQVFHESLAMLAYVFMDPVSAMNSQRIYIERQHSDGYINYRTGPYLNETIPYNNQLTTSAPWFAWENLEIYRVTEDKNFLAEAYESSKRFYDYLINNRDDDKDGLCEWGAHAVLESVRDGYVAVWDEVGWPSNFEALDLNCMLVKESKSLEEMAEVLGYNEDAHYWNNEWNARKGKINEVMWDEETGFYYHVDKKDNDFSFKKKNDLKREEIIGFLPLWAGVADENRANRLISKLTDENKFWRKYGIPTLAADDPYYNPKGYWNGPVWVQWNFLIVDGLLQYGYVDEAKELVKRVSENMIAQLKKDHQFWEFYSADDQWAGYHRQYIWAGIINRMIMDTFK